MRRGGVSVPLSVKNPYARRVADVLGDIKLADRKETSISVRLRERIEQQIAAYIDWRPGSVCRTERAERQSMRAFFQTWPAIAGLVRE